MGEQTYYFTFGSGQVHQDCYVKVTVTPTEQEPSAFWMARHVMIQKFGTMWSMQYTQEQWITNGVSQAEEYNLKEIS